MRHLLPPVPHHADEFPERIGFRPERGNGDERHPFGVGDVLFVPAGVIHRFEDFSDDFATWVFFYGPEGGESP